MEIAVHRFAFETLLKKSSLYLVSCLFSSNGFQLYWVNWNRHIRRDLRYHLNKLPCKVALVKDDLSLEIWKSHNTHDTKVTATKFVFSLSKFVSLSDCHCIEDIEHSIVSFKSYPHSIVASDTSTTIRSYTKQSSVNRSRDYSSVSEFGSSSKQERSGDQEACLILFMPVLQVLGITHVIAFLAMIWNHL